jgi:uncharacterized Zn-finger protein
MRDHNKEGQNIYDWPRCGMMFKQSDSVKRHKTIHTGDKPYMCDICKKRFSRLYNLNVHRKRHGTEVSFIQKRGGAE